MSIETKLLTSSDISIAAELLKAGECVAFPTETVYGLGANALDEVAVRKIFAAKGRPADNPLIVHCHSQAQLVGIVQEYSPSAKKLMDAFWPGPLSLVLPKRDVIPEVVSGGLETVAVRIPDHPLALRLLELVGLPIAAPSANVSTKPSPTRASHVFEDMNGKIAAIVDGGETGWGVESTVVDCTVVPFRLLRPGGITLEQLRSVTAVVIDQGMNGIVDGAPRSPGMKYKHYAPNAEVVLVIGPQVPGKINQLLAEHRKLGKTMGVMAFTENLTQYAGEECVLDMGSLTEKHIVASRIFHLLREADHKGLELLFVEGLGEDDLGMAIMNRLRKAAGHRIIHS